MTYSLRCADTGASCSGSFTTDDHESFSRALSRAHRDARAWLAEQESVGERIGRIEVVLRGARNPSGAGDRRNDGR